jgi:hypothetical protein
MCNLLILLSFAVHLSVAVCFSTTPVCRHMELLTQELIVLVHRLHCGPPTSEACYVFVVCVRTPLAVVHSVTHPLCSLLFLGVPFASCAGTWSC